MLGANSARFGRAAGFEHDVAAIFQDAGGHLSNGRVVFHDQQGAAAGPGCCVVRWLLSWDGHLVQAWEVDPERGAVPELAVDADVPATLLHDAVDGCEAEPRALPDFFGGEEWFENAPLRLRGHPGAGVLDRQ